MFRYGICVFVRSEKFDSGNFLTQCFVKSTCREVKRDLNVICGLQINRISSMVVAMRARSSHVKHRNLHFTFHTYFLKFRLFFD